MRQTATSITVEFSAQITVDIYRASPEIKNHPKQKKVLANTQGTGHPFISSGFPGDDKINLKDSQINNCPGINHNGVTLSGGKRNEFHLLVVLHHKISLKLNVT